MIDNNFLLEWYEQASKEKNFHTSTLSEAAKLVLEEITDVAFVLKQGEHPLAKDNILSTLLMREFPQSGYGLAINNLGVVSIYSITNNKEDDKIKSTIINEYKMKGQYLQNHIFRVLNFSADKSVGTSESVVIKDKKKTVLYKSDIMYVPEHVVQKMYDAPTFVQKFTDTKRDLKEWYKVLQ